MVISLNDAAHYYKGLPHQKEAFEFVQGRLSKQTLEKFADIYRNGPPPSTSKALGFQGRLKKRLKDLNISLYTGGSKGYGYTVIGVEGVDKSLFGNGNVLDKWNDIAIGVKAYPNGRWEIVGPFICTVNPGRYYTVNALNSLGAAHPKPNVKHNAIWQLGWHKNQRDCLVQIGGPITVVRDRNKNGRRDVGEPEQTGYFGMA